MSIFFAVEIVLLSLQVLSFEKNCYLESKTPIIKEKPAFISILYYLHRGTEMIYQWSTALSVGDITIDQQHKELIKQTNNLLEGMLEGNGVAEIKSLILFLEVYIQKHFFDEEMIMKQAEYPRIEMHKQIHRMFVVDYLKLKKDFLKNPNSTLIHLQFQSSVCDWVVNHVSKEDRLFGEFIRSTCDGVDGLL